MANEIGYQVGSVLKSWVALSIEAAETNPELFWPRSIEVYDRMRREDSQVASVMRAVTLPIRSAKWLIDPAGAKPEVTQLVADDLGLPIKGVEPTASLRTRGRFSWSEHLRLALLELVYGHSIFEQVYAFDEVDKKQHLAKLAWRPPRTIADLFVDTDGGLISIQQWGVLGPNVIIPVKDLVMYVNEREGGNWLGTSLLRTAYKNWLLKDRALRTQALTLERNGLGVPTYTAAPVPDTASSTERDDWLLSEKDAGLALAKSFRVGEAAGASIPAGSKLELVSVMGKLPDADSSIRYHDEQIARAVLAHFLNLGTETGSWALGSTFANFFTDSLNAVAAHVADVTQQHVVEDLVDLNFGPDEPAPRLTFESIGAAAPVTGEAINYLMGVGAITYDPALEAAIRSTFGLPQKDDNFTPDPPKPDPAAPPAPAPTPAPKEDA